MQRKIRVLVMSKPTMTNAEAEQIPWMAERRLERRDAVGGLVVVRVGHPEWPPAAEEWRCPYMISGLGDDSIEFAHSVDSIAAIQNALRGIYWTFEQTGIPLRWEGFDDDAGNDTGFPMDTDAGYGLAFRQRIERMILDEEAKLAEPTREREEQKRREARRKARAAKARKDPQVRDVNMPAPPRTTSESKRTRWIAERRLARCDAVGSIVLVRMGAPELPSRKNVWRCPFTILGLGDDDSIHFGHGGDSMASLQNALRGIRCTFEQSGVPLRWALQGLEENDTGFPMDTDRGYGLAFRRRMEQMIQAEIEELVRPIRERHERREARRKARAKPRTE
ncbi:hypothetical protein E8A74_40965 [Polyangium fumosum]|uniref:DUF6968 domain-containing protein n=1 Tax=Polyangium fumosum TaxID=889272 RepID=A0A4U1IVT2_9BACT|nr:hypothetical protein E8A74_40965 [Polyangium fumosum]